MGDPPGEHDSVRRSLAGPPSRRAPRAALYVATSTDYTVVMVGE